jgi:hypothetical protein
MHKSSITNLIILSLAIFIISCGKTQSSAENGPAAALLATYQALETHDSIGFIQSLTLEKQNEYAMYPDRISKILSSWDSGHADVKILSVKQTDTTATILYNLRVTGPKPRTKDSMVADLYLVNGEWKNGY